ncbi:MAG: hypothetical protein ACW96X_09090 [Promethearchaeota archaeon]|jgi:hypothetical protein
MKEVYIFDIDGCIMPPIFSDFNMDESREKTIKKIVDNSNNLELYPDFIRFYDKHCKNAELIFFITGRKGSEFGKLTEKQLESLSNIRKFQIIYYPEKKSHKIRKYFSWKVKKIKKVIKNAIKLKNSKDNSEIALKFNVFDDMDGYFSKIEDFATHYGVQAELSLIDNENSWNNLYS